MKATGYTVAELSGFLEMAESLSLETDITDEFAKYLFSVKDTTPVAEFTKNCTANADNTEPHECCMQEMERQDREIRTLKRLNLFLTLALIVVAVGARF